MYTNTHLISIIIPVHGSSKTLSRTIESLLAQKLTRISVQIEILLVSDRCNMVTEELLEQLVRKYTIIKRFDSKSAGVNAARNTGISNAAGELLVFLDDDCILPDTDWIERLWKHFQEHDDTDALGGGYIVAGTDDLFDICWNELAAYHILSNLSARNRANALLGGNSAYPKRVFMEHGYFDTNISYGCAETEFIEKLVRNGGKVYYYDDISVYHITTASNKPLEYLIKNFRRGCGRSYIDNLNKVAAPNAIWDNTRLWFIEIVKIMRLNIYRKLFAGVILFTYSLSYWIGYSYGTLFYRFQGRLIR